MHGLVQRVVGILNSFNPQAPPFPLQTQADATAPSASQLEKLVESVYK